MSTTNNVKDECVSMHNYTIRTHATETSSLQAYWIRATVDEAVAEAVISATAAISTAEIAVAGLLLS
jgi:hypothetical protein